MAKGSNFDQCTHRSSNSDDGLAYECQRPKGHRDRHEHRDGFAWWTNDPKPFKTSL
jgi:hypothetical protein